MNGLARNIATVAASALVAVAIGAGPASADAHQPPPGPVTITVPSDAIDVPSEMLPLFTPTGIAATRADATTAPVAVLADEIRAAATLPQVMDNVRNWIIGLLS